MNSDSAPELRVLTGTHAGARALLAADGALIGAGDDCDFILSDAGIAAQHARLTADAGGWQVHWLDDATAPPVRLAPDRGVSVGPVLITVDAANAAWPTWLPPTAVMAEESPSEAREAPPAAAAALPVPVHPPPSWRRWAVVGGVACAMAAGFATVWLLRPAAPPEPALPVPSANPATAAVSGREQILAVAAALGLASRVRVDIGGNGALVARAALLSDEEAEALAAALSHLSPRPGLRLSSEGDLRQGVDEALARQAAAWQLPLAASYLGQGRFRLEGRVPGEGERQALLAGLRAEFPEVEDFEAALLTPAEAAAAMVADLRAAGIAEVDGQWRDGQLRLDVRLAERDIPRWEQALVRSAARHALPFTARLQLLASAPAVQAALPFRLQSVIGGQTPYVVLGDGSKLMTGGSRQGWRLVEITAQHVVFQTSAAQRVEVAR